MRGAATSAVLSIGLLVGCGDAPPAPAAPVSPTPPAAPTFPVPADRSADQSDVRDLRRILVADFRRRPARDPQTSSQRWTQEVIRRYGGTRSRLPQRDWRYPDAWLAPSEVGE